MKLNVHLVTWNGSKYIPYLFESLRNQTFKDWKLVVLDNASSDDTVEKIKHELQNLPFEHELIVNKENKGFAGGHNQLVERHSEQSEESLTKHRDLSTSPPASGFAQDDEGEYVLLLNQDMYLMPDCLEKLVEFMDENKEASVVSPRLMKWDFGSLPLTKREFAGDLGFATTSATPPTPSWKEGDVELSFTNQIDTLGLKVLRSRRVIEKYTGKDWDHIKSKMELSHHTSHEAMEVFGVSGALPMYRKSIIEEVGLFDESFNSYKEDIDLAYRLRLAGYKAYVLLDTIAYHDRSAEGLEKRGDRVAMKNKKNQSQWVKYHSYKNHLMTLYKNEYWQNFIFDLPWIKWYEFKKFCYFLLFDRSVLKGLREIWQNRKDLKIKRLKIKKMRKISWGDMRKWWNH